MNRITLVVLAFIVAGLGAAACGSSSTAPSTVSKYTVDLNTDPYSIGSQKVGAGWGLVIQTTVVGTPPITQCEFGMSVDNPKLAQIEVGSCNRSPGYSTMTGELGETFNEVVNFRGLAPGTLRTTFWSTADPTKKKTFSVDIIP
jgi:hypothetical protein